jgi:hypothetical protein
LKDEYTKLTLFKVEKFMDMIAKVMKDQQW